MIPGIEDWISSPKVVVEKESFSRELKNGKPIEGESMGVQEKPNGG